APRRAGEVDDESRAPQAGDAAREECVRRSRERVGAYRLRDSRGFPLDRVPRCLRRSIARRDPGAARRPDELGLVGEAPDRVRDSSTLVGHDTADYVEPLFHEERLEDVPARVLTYSCVDAVGDREHGRLHAGSFDLETSRTASISIAASTALAMS